MSKKLQVGITGGIGSGKSTVCKIFETFDIPVYDADERAKYLMHNHDGIRNNIVKVFGDKSIDSEGKLNRDFLASQVFPNPEKLSILNSIVHPEVAIDFANWVEFNNKAEYMLKEAALLVETGVYKSLDKLIVVTAPMEERIDRVLKRDPFRSREELMAIISRQATDEEKVKCADFIIDNSDDNPILDAVKQIHAELLKLA